MGLQTLRVPFYQHEATSTKPVGSITVEAPEKFFQSCFGSTLCQNSTCVCTFKRFQTEFMRLFLSAGTGLNSVPSKIPVYLESQKVTLFANRVFRMQLVEMRSHRMRVGPNPMTGVLISREHRDTDTHTQRTPCNDRGGDWINKMAIHPYKEMLFSHGNEWNTDTCCNTDEPSKHFAE